MSGWILNFFPYKKNGKTQYQFASLKELKEVFEKRERGEHVVYDREIDLKSVPKSYSQVPFIWNEATKNVKIDMTIVTGFMGMS